MNVVLIPFFPRHLMCDHLPSPLLSLPVSHSVLPVHLPVEHVIVPPLFVVSVVRFLLHNVDGFMWCHTLLPHLHNTSLVEVVCQFRLVSVHPKMPTFFFFISFRFSPICMKFSALFVEFAFW